MTAQANERMSEERIAEIQARADAAVPGPWQACGHDRGGCQCGNVWSLPADAPITSGMSANKREHFGQWSDETTTANAEFIAHAREDIPALLAEIARLREPDAQRLSTEPATPSGSRSEALEAVALAAQAMLSEGDSEGVFCDDDLRASLDVLSAAQTPEPAS